MFTKIANADNTGLIEKAYEELQKYSNEPITVHTSDPKNQSELLERVKGAECILVSWRTKITKELIDSCPNLKYIGMCCSLLDEKAANVDVPYARSKGIKVLGVRDYGDEGVIEYIFSELIRLVKGLGNAMWQEVPTEISGRKLGIIGMGATGQMLAKAASAFNMQVFYFSRTRKPSLESNSLRYLPLEELLKQVEFLSFHLPRNTCVMGAKEFEILGNEKIIINTSLGLPFNKNDLTDWLNHPLNYAICDADSTSYLEDLKSKPNFIYNERVMGWTSEARVRLSQKVIENLLNVLAEL